MAQVLVDHLAEFLYMQEESPVENCMMFPADWVLAITGKDPADHLRGRYPSTRETWRALGDLTRVLADVAGRAGLARVEAAELGDVAVVRVPVFGPMGAVCCGERRWAIKCDDGLLTHRFEVISEIWRPTCLRQ